ncbi:2-C-methyl-D-erythritol 4-phosphate cytidylyltransferase [Uliginosibacterium gangwonense]|uniref:2-C-methyl-D-erythritol 4-phosphate cytidylyltransferase n=1 Tax=Uliginosibacterium gangwonense TaxID=392736 RepID=UPI0003623F08|nr:2-C-methyl-D-erythritol 4-phosphate cytidylyltransferase [Uliginosibacterium gangwonense]
MSKFFAIVPAAGSGSRMGSQMPKQYLSLAGKPMLWYALSALLAVPAIETVTVVLAPDDTCWQDFDWSGFGPRLQVLRVGGATRAASVTQALEALKDSIGDEEWVLVHDAARACLLPEQVEALIATLKDDPVGGLLAVPVADTLKRADSVGRVADTISREAMWQAQTPQMFRYGLLLRALTATGGVTDEAGAVEALGMPPRLVAGDITNFKVTYPQDIALAEMLLRARSV